MHAPPAPPPGQEEFDACELPSKARRDALAAALQIPARSVQVGLQTAPRIWAPAQCIRTASLCIWAASLHI